MAGADVVTLLRGMADYLTTIPGIKRGIYPAIGHPAPGHLPVIVLFSGSPQGISTVDPDMDGAMWTAELAGQLLVVNQGDTGKDIHAADKLITPVVDAFTVNTSGRNPALDAIDAGGQIDHLTLYGYFTGGITYAGQSYVGANLYWRAKFHRYPEAIP